MIYLPELVLNGVIIVVLSYIIGRCAVAIIALIIDKCCISSGRLASDKRHGHLEVYTHQLQGVRVETPMSIDPKQAQLDVQVRDGQWNVQENDAKVLLWTVQQPPSYEECHIEAATSVKQNQTSLFHYL